MPVLEVASPPVKRQSIPIYVSIEQFHNVTIISKRGNSDVLHATCRTTGIQVAIKRFNKRALTAKEAVHVGREVMLLGILRGHPGVVQVLGIFEDDESAYIVMEYCAGRDLYHAIVGNQNCSESYAASTVIFPLLQTLHRLHTEHSLIHRDIKPENILLNGYGSVCLADFGTAIQQDIEVPFLPVGTLDFMAPEVLTAPVPRGAVESPCMTPDMLQEAGLRPYDEKVDIWSLGVLTYELVVGRPPFHHDDPEEIRRRILESRKIYMPRHLQGTPCSDFILAAMTRDARARPSAFQLLQHPWVLQHAKVSHEEDGTGQEPPPWQKNYGGAGNSESDARGMVHHIHVTAHGTSTASNASISSYTSLHAASALEKSLQERPGLGPPPPAAPSTSSKTALDDEDIAAAMAMAHIRVAAVSLAVGGKEPKDANLEGGGSEGLKRVRPIVHGPLPSGCTEGCTPRPRKVSRLSQNSHSQGSQESRCDITHGMVLNGESNQEATSAKALRRGISCPAPAKPARWLKKFSLKRASFSG